MFEALKYNVSYSNLQFNLPKIVDDIKKFLDTTKKLVLVGVPRGGLYLTQDLSYLLDTNFIILADSFEGLISKLVSDLNEYQILVCDDIYDTGKRYKEFDALWEHPQNRMVVQIARYKDSLPKNVIYGDTLEHNEYVWFPWELQN